MGTYSQLLYQIVFSTKNRQPILKKENRKELFKYICGILNNKNCHLYRINGVSDHIHIITHIHPTESVSDIVKVVKISSGNFIKSEKLFTEFEGWQDGYGAFTYKITALDRLIEYVKNQEKHHKNVSYKEEFISLLEEHKIKFDERYLI
ncbi:IS200/IS605 family transposase [Rhodohalobacter barkolensis]|uniref:Transposase n=1 Tax=Rhodohalobacter barkolensis TaxID=2053187 RepID=A0A2N0VGU7_9BACT|nr:IS200/IS605 family transposase [Rhodohalobacter barkolensis]PKD43436.1 transposase [Rhodohalobacter barkolensis]